VKELLILENLKKMVAITLNMIVKNEESIIERCLSSVLPVIDSFAILDTGSDDSTIKKIKDFFSKSGKKGIIKKGKFENFGKTRNQALHLAYSIKSDYILLLDADMILVTNNFDKSELTVTNSDFYNLIQETKYLEFKNTRIIKNNQNFYYKGYTHEAVLPLKKENCVGRDISKTSLYIKDIEDGGCKEKKTERDLRLLHLEINDDPNYSRAYFYLANTYFGSKEWEKAEKFYRIRIQFDGWKEEIWYSYYRLAMIRVMKKQIPEAIWFLQSSIEVQPLRLESYFHLMCLYMDHKMDRFLDIIRREARKIFDQKPDTTNFLFYEKRICEEEIKKFFIS
jgi:tetratricopeptide (TPR) repeat protein